MTSDAEAVASEIQQAAITLNLAMHPGCDVLAKSIIAQQIAPLQAELERVKGERDEARATRDLFRSRLCPTCAGTRRLHIVEGCTTPAHDIDCPTCIGTPLAGGVRIFSEPRS